MRSNRTDAVGIGMFILMLSLVLVGIGFSITGFVIAFSASVILGIACFVVPPMPFVFGAAYWLFGINLAAKIIAEIKSYSGS
jgi:hypothetical protein